MIRREITQPRRQIRCRHPLPAEHVVKVCQQVPDHRGRQHQLGHRRTDQRYCRARVEVGHCSRDHFGGGVIAVVGLDVEPIDDLEPPGVAPVPVIADPADRLIWVSPALPGARQDMGQLLPTLQRSGRNI